MVFRVATRVAFRRTMFPDVGTSREYQINDAALRGNLAIVVSMIVPIPRREVEISKELRGPRMCLIKVSNFAPPPSLRESLAYRALVCCGLLWSAVVCCGLLWSPGTEPAFFCLLSPSQRKTERGAKHYIFLKVYWLPCQLSKRRNDKIRFMDHRLGCQRI